jgi:hypothetical protein
MNLFLATELTLGEQNLMDDERIDVGWFTAKRMRDMIQAVKFWTQRPSLRTIFGWIGGNLKSDTVNVNEFMPDNPRFSILCG